MDKKGGEKMLVKTTLESLKGELATPNPNIETIIEIEEQQGIPMSLTATIKPKNDFMLSVIGLESYRIYPKQVTKTKNGDTTEITLEHEDLLFILKAVKDEQKLREERIRKLIHKLRELISE